MFPAAGRVEISPANLSPQYSGHSAASSDIPSSASAFSKLGSSFAHSLAKRLRFPDLALDVAFSYAASGGPFTSSNTTPPTLTLGISGSLPVFYQQQGEIRKAEADLRTQTLERGKTEAQVSSEVDSAFKARMLNWPSNSNVNSGAQTGS